MPKRRLFFSRFAFIALALLVVVSLLLGQRFRSSSSNNIDPIMLQLFSIQTPNPWLIQVPESDAQAKIESYDIESMLASGTYSDGADQGLLSVSTRWMTAIETSQFASIITVSNQGSGVFYYLATFEYDSWQKRMVLKSTLFLGDRIRVKQMQYQFDSLELEYFSHSELGPLADEPDVLNLRQFTISKQLTLLEQN